MNIKDQVISIIADQAFLTPSDVSMSSTLDSLGIDSMGIVESIFAIEETFDVSVPFNANQPDATGFDISSVASIVAGVERLRAEQA
ncbi:MAG: acyl carrier protein [Sulfitobacter litoralis]|jgi:acyl carrier protein|uniref:Acyl carrier protein n=2 Tax=root TaxID=1 RepID=A0A1H0LBM8_9RHOB|nr:MULTISPECIES: acyl carrier protein [Sulfitobacter]MBQ0717063.1 acyl carrier protein [Sulfitobacter litoralis]MBQ0767257.1 acyl carrier protein [Sulfitobacter litoralis]MBQ0803208.1 acyl carrier protein [Sulfitobacter litoralis]MCF7725837.1 acyl carrier protein [Sulfitobacter sp. M22]MCF7777163.1 acyl carrier protein [Sulfitobacter sp. M220]|tara:strand:- start:46 stop:303 length:258 start_codon:yes stop_codon:yes gene_type:complete